jgi:hypothetical protein
LRTLRSSENLKVNVWPDHDNPFLRNGCLDNPLLSLWWLNNLHLLLSWLKGIVSLDFVVCFLVSFDRSYQSWAFATFSHICYSLIRYFNAAIHYRYSTTFLNFAIRYRYSLFATSFYFPFKLFISKLNVSAPFKSWFSDR